MAGELDLARNRYRQARELARATKDGAAECLALGGLVQVSLARGEDVEAADALSLQEELGSGVGLRAAAAVLRSRAAVAHAQGLASAAAAHRRGELLVRQRMEDLPGILDQLEELALCAAGFGDSSTAASLMASAQTFRRRTGLRIPPDAQARLERVQIGELATAISASALVPLSIGQAISLGLRVARG